MRVVGYLRISRDEDHENYISIEQQRKIIQDYARSKDWVIERFYEDDNYSGYIFNRPGFEALNIACEKKRIDIIMAKDLSRLGRHNAKTLLFIEEMHKKGIRIVLPEEGTGFDTEKDEDDFIGIKSWYNERYIKDISRKVKASLHIKQKKGELLMGVPYGYQRSKNDKLKLLVDPQVAPVIRRIFNMFIDGMTYKEICAFLNRSQVNTPSKQLQAQYHTEGREYKQRLTTEWQSYQVQRIVENDFYIGTLRTHKRKNRSIKGIQVNVPKEEQYIFLNNHEPIVDKEKFELAQEIRLKRGERSKNYTKKLI